MKKREIRTRLAAHPASGLETVASIREGQAQRQRAEILADERRREAAAEAARQEAERQ